MKTPDLIQEVLSLPIDDRWMVVYAVLSSIEGGKEEDQPLYSWQMEKIEEAKRELESGKVQAVSLDRFKQHIQERIENWNKSNP